MRKMLRANFARLWKNKLFWLCVAVMATISISEVFDNLKWVRNGETIAGDGLMFGFALMVGVALAAFCSLFIGTEYADGTVRNRLIVGNGRAAIYGANLLTSVAAGLMFCAAYILPSAVLGRLLLGKFQAGVGEILTFLLASLGMTVALSSLICCGAMLIHNRSASAVALLMFVFGMLLCSMVVSSRLEDPPTYQNYVLVNEYGVPLQVEEEPNPHYLTGRKREVFQFLSDFLPTGQGNQIASRELSEGGGWKLPLYSLSITLASSIAGLVLFRKKDIK